LKDVWGGQKVAPFFDWRCDVKVVDYRDVPLEPVAEEGAKGVKVRWVIKKEDGAKRFAMRAFHVEPGGCTPCHSHPWEHEVFILQGEAQVLKDEEWVRAPAGTVLFIEENEGHQFKNLSHEELIFICLVPYLD
jgi:quercetin dioxygenase-like cupin family protein